MNLITQVELMSFLHYDAKSGIFSSRITRGRWKCGEPVGSISSDGYLCIKINGRIHKGHRLAYLYVSGSFPPSLVDHVNGVRSDNRWENLRHATACENTRNAKTPITNTSGVKGVCFHRQTGKWVVRAWDGSGRNRYGGLFEDINDAENAAIALRERLHRDFANHGERNDFCNR